MSLESPTAQSRSSEGVAGRNVPHDVDAESAVLGAVLIDNLAIHEVISLISAEHFYLPAHQIVFTAMLGLQNSGKPIDLVLLRSALEEQGSLERAGGLEGLLALAQIVPSAANAKHYAQIVRDKGLARNLIRTAAEVIEDAFAWEGDATALVDEAEAKIFKLSEHGGTREAREIGHVLFNETWPLIESLHDTQKPYLGCRTGFYEFDDTLAGGFHNGELIVVAGRPSMGKTSFALNCALNFATIETGQKAVAVFSLEVSRTQLAMNMLCMHARLDASRIRKGELSKDEQVKALDTANELMKLPILIIDDSSMGIYSLRAKARRLKHAYPNLSLILIDYLQLMEGASNTRRGAENRQQEIAEISRGLKSLARELEVPVVALSQLNRSVDQRAGHVPQLSDLRESGAIEQDADVVCFLYREEYYQPENVALKGKADLIIAKQRNGPTGKVDLQFSGKHMRFDNLYYGDPLDEI